MDIKKAFLLGKFCVKLVVSGLVLLFLCQGPGVRYKPDKEFPSLTLVSDAYADVPARINYQGRYRENGIPVDGTRHFQFKLIDSQWSSGNVRYDSSDQSVTITKGLFHYVLEPALHATTWDNQSLWLHVWVGADSPDTHLDVGGVTNAGERVSSALYSYYSMSAYNATNATGTFTIDSSGGYSSAFTAGAQAGNVSYTLPTALPASNKYLQCTDAGVLSWETGGAEGTPGGDDGEVQYNNGGIFNGGDALYYDDGNSRLGIGTTSPGNKLHVLNTGGAATNAAGYFELTDASNSSFAMYAMAPTKAIYASGNINIKASQYLNFGETSGDSGYGIKDNGGTIQYKNSGGAGWANLTEAVGYWTRDAGNGYLYAATITDKLGIGTTAPGEELDLVGQLAITDSAFSQRGFIGKGLNDDFSIVSKNSTAWLRLGCGTSGAITFFTDGTAETGDNWKFAMYGDATYTRLILDFSAATAQKARLASIADGSIYLMANYNYDAGSWAKDNTSAAGSVIYAGTDYGLKVYTRTAADGDGSPSEKMTITLGGNVGIGTTDPAGSLLHTRNTAASNSAGYFELTNASNSSYAVYALGPTNAIYASGNIVVTGTVDGVDISTITFGSDDMGNHTATTNIQLGSNWLSGDGGNEGVYVGSTGNVGIGTSNPNNKLHIQGDSNGVALAILNQVGTNQYAGYRIDRDGTETWLLGVSNADDSLRLRYNGSTDNFVMDTIGNTTIAGDLTITGLDINSAADTKFGGGYGGTGVTIESDGDITIDGNAVVDGKIAIGTTVPNYNLSIVEDGNPTLEIANPNASNPATAGALVFREGSGTVWGTDIYGMGLLYDGSNNKMYVQGAAAGAASTLVTIPRAGGVGIGTTDPAGSTLHSYNTATSKAAGYFQLTNASNASYAVYAYAPTNAIYASGGIVSNSQGDSSILLEADTDNASDENDNPWIKFSQDGGQTTSILGEVGTAGKDPENNNYTDTLADAALLGTIDDTVDGTLQLGTKSAVRVTILTDGKIGIGTNVPLNTLDIQGNVAVGANYAGVQTLSAANGMAIAGRLGIHTYQPDSYGALTIWQTADENDEGIYILNNAASRTMRVWVDGSDQARIDSASDGSGTLLLNGAGSGKVAIGTTTPAGSKLHSYNSGTSNAAGYFELTNASNSSYAVYAMAPALANAIYASGNISVTGTIDGVDISTVSFDGDDLGNHTATTNIQLGSNWLSGDGNNEGVYVGSTGNVGIGTSSPANRLHVQGASGADALTILNQVGTDAYGGYRVDRDGSEKWFLGVSDANDSLRLRRAATTDDLVIDTSGNTTVTGDLTISGNDINSAADTKFGGGYGGTGVTIEADGDLTVDGNAIADGKIAIGTTAAAYEPLEVAGTGRAFFGDGGGANRKGLEIDGVETYGGRIQAYDYGATAALNLILQGMGGNVGVGTTAPGNGRLESYSNDTTNSAGYFKLANASNSSYAVYALAPTNAIYASGNVSLTGDLTVSGNDINSAADTKFGGGYGSTGVTIESDGDLSANGNAIIDGNVGIGTTVANYILSVVKDGGATIELGDPNGGNPSGAANIIFNENIGAGYTWGTNVEGFRLTYDGSTNNFIIQSAAGGASTDRVTIARATGNVGVGTSSPVNGRIESYNNDTTYAAGYFNLANASNSSYSIYALAPTNAIYASGNISLTGDLTVSGNDINSAADTKFGGGYGSTGITLESDGDLTMDGDITVGGNDIKDSGGNNQITFTAGSLASFAYDIKVTGNDVQDSGGAAVLTFDGSGNTTAKGTLTVLDTDYTLFQVGGGTFTVKGGGVRLLPTDTVPSTEEGTMYANDTANILRYYNGSGWVDLLANCYWTQSGTKLYYDAGNVGIGTTDPAGSTLHSYNSAASNAAGYFQLTNASNSSFSVYAYAPTNAIYASGNISIGDSSPSVPLTITGGDDVVYNSAGTGYLIIGNDAGAHMAIDDNEIMAKGSATTNGILYLSTYDVRIGNSSSHNYSQLLLTNSAHTSYILDAGDAPAGLKFYSNNGTEPSIIIEPGAPGAASGFVGVGDGLSAATIDTIFDVRADGDECADFDRASSDGVIVYFSRDNVAVGDIRVSGGAVTLTAFTGSHYAWTNEKIERGMLVSLTGQNKYLNDNPEHEIIYGVTTTSRANDPAVLGAYLCHQEPNDKMKDDLHIIMAVGNGDMWIVDKGEDINTGDFLISSDISGHAMKDQDNQYMVSYVIARAVEPIKWSEVKDTINGIKHKKISVTFESFIRNKITQLSSEIKSRSTEMLELKKKTEDKTTDIKELHQEIIALKKQIEDLKKR